MMRASLWHFHLLTTCLLLLACANVLAQTSSAAEESSSDVPPEPHAIASAVERALYLDEVLSFKDVRVAAENGTVTLAGTVKTLIASERAERIAETVRGVQAVNNELRVSPEHSVDQDQLVTRVEDALIANTATDVYEVQVTSPSAGVVKLSGHVDSGAEKELVGRIARSVAGAIEVRNELIVDYTRARADDELVDEITEMLRWDIYVEAALIRVAAENGYVSLSGLVGSAAEKRRARALAWITGVKGVDTSALEVVSWAREDKLKDLGPTSPEEIESAVSRSLANDPRTPSRVVPEIENGVVTLRGEVLSVGEKRAAISATYSIAGVKSVRDHMRVKGPPEDVALPQWDTRIERAIVSALDAHAVTEPRDLQVSVERSIATLLGEVDSSYERAAADTVAAGVRGVRQVNNRLSVPEEDRWVAFNPYVDEWPLAFYDWYSLRPRVVRTEDEDLKREVQSQLKWSPYVDAEDIEVDVHAGVVVLKGKVGSERERDAARANARRSGAAQVVDRLEIVE